jgi:hypothetical protein
MQERIRVGKHVQIIEVIMITQTKSVSELYQEVVPIWESGKLDQTVFNRYATAILQAAQGDADELEPLFANAQTAWKRAWLDQQPALS